LIALDREKPKISNLPQVGFMRIRIVLVSEEELREIASGNIQPSEVRAFILQ
jgi:hypothetical protein